MDEEDLALQAESQKLETVGTFAGLGDAAPLRSKGMFSDIFRSTQETMGLRLLQKMGWRQGQGIGPKIRRRAQGDKTGETHLFAPDNTEIVDFVRKTDRRGVGFGSEDRPEMDNDGGDDADSDADASILKRNRSKVAVKPGKLKKKAGIGMGVLNDTGSDDDDSLEIGPSLSYSRVIGGDKKRKKRNASSDPAAEQSTVPAKVSARRGLDRTISLASSNVQRCHDGRLPLPGFILSFNLLQISQAVDYPPPSIPNDWKSTKQLQDKDRSQEPFQSTSDAAKVSTLNAKSRAAMLGEQELPGKSIFDFISPAVRDKIANATGNKHLPQGRGESAPENAQVNVEGDRRTLWDLIPPLTKDTAMAALHRVRTGFRPYEDEYKRERYRYFLELRAGIKHQIPERPRGLSLDEWSHELREFAQAAAVFKPMSGLMALRFTTSKGGSEMDESAVNTNDVEEDPAEKAAKLGMFGAMTRQTQSFYPTRLLCKRFGVPPPANAVSGPPDETSTGRKGVRGLLGDASSADILGQDSIDRILRDSSSHAPLADTSAYQRNDVRDMSSPAADVDVEINEALEANRADDSVLRAVFGDGEGEDDGRQQTIKPNRI
ncbi:hypothetical protein K431DRAFT_254845 [Polychaeton citri CBS 116435]|uniref:G-patch domain-containing protein n=1 Tax=Polychaeton citri CBS 116435 TaxID=1314669 RepID=A0A9P4UMA1_9PEZI|nr:hypothetical protein K431DRAFT_254845 [Polychaeton citri CBS 116435]